MMITQNRKDVTRCRFGPSVTLTIRMIIFVKRQRKKFRYNSSMPVKIYKESEASKHEKSISARI